MKHVTRVLVILLALVIAMMSSGCFIFAPVKATQVGIILKNGTSLSDIVEPKRYTNFSPWARLRVVDLTVKTLEWSDPDLVTSDTQPIGIALAVSYHLRGDSECITKMYKEYNSELFNAKLMEALVRTRIPSAAKNNTAKLTLDQMLGARTAFAEALETEIAAELATICLITDTVQVVNIQPQQGYLDKLAQKALVIVDRDIASEAVETAKKNLEKTKAETDIELELARRKNLVNAEMSKVYDTSPEMFTLKRLELIAQIVAAAQPGNMMIFVPEGSDLSFINSTKGDVVPVVTNNPPAQQ